MTNLKKYIHTRELFYIQRRFTKIPFLFYNYSNIKGDNKFMVSKTYFVYYSSRYLMPFNSFFNDFKGTFYLTPLRLNSFELENIKQDLLIGVSVGNYILNRYDLIRLYNIRNAFSTNGFNILGINSCSFLFGSFTRIYKLFIFLLFNYAYSKSINS